MTKAELTKLIIVVYALERRADAPSQAVVEAWHPSLAGYSHDEALQVVLKHYEESDRPVTLAQLCAGVGKLRADRRGTGSVEEQLRIPDADPDDTGAFIAALKDRRYLPDRDPADFPGVAVDVAAVGRRVPQVAGDEVRDETPRPRRWWMRGRGREPEKEDE